MIETLLAFLSELGHLENTLIAIASDHGEAFLERGHEGHARVVYRESTEIPFLVSLPFRLEPGIVVGGRTRNVDVWPTILDLLGLELPEGTDGRSLLPDILASGRGEAPTRAGASAIAHLDQTWGRRGFDPLPTVAVAEDTFRYVRSQGIGGVTIEQLFDASDDPHELRDRAADDPETLARLGAIADTHIAEEPAWGDAPTREIDELELNLLRALGYAIP